MKESVKFLSTYISWNVSLVGHFFCHLLCVIQWIYELIQDGAGIVCERKGSKGRENTVVGISI